MHGLAPLVYDLALMLGVAGIVAIIFQRIHQPIVLGYLVAGMIIGPNTPPYSFIKDTLNIQTLSQLGVIFLMFSLGLEFSFHKLMRVGFSASIIGLVEVLVMVLVGYTVGLTVGFTHYDSLFLGAALAISSTTIILKAIEELNLKTKRFAELIFGVLIVEDLLAILLLVALSTVVVTKNIFSFDMLHATNKLVLVVGSWFLVGYFLVPTIFRHISAYISQETLTIISVALCLFLVTTASYFHYSAALGAFIMGSILAETVLVHRIAKRINPIRDIFAAVFFISVGMLIDPVIIYEHWEVILILTLVTIVGKLTLTSLASFLTGQSITTSVRAGFSMAQIGEFSFIIVALGVSLHVVSAKLYPIVVAVSGVTTFTTPYLIRLSGWISGELDKRLPGRLKYFLNSYAAWVYRAQSASQKKPLLRMVTTRLIINGIIVAILFTLVNHMLLPQLQMLITQRWLVSTISLLMSLVIASPFIWGMLFAYKQADIPSYARTKWSPAVFMVWLVTLTEIVVLTFAYFHSLITDTAVILIVIIFFSFAFQHLERSYHWFERQLLRNIKKQAGSHLRYEELAPWDTHLVEIIVGDHSPFRQKKLIELTLRQRFGINIVAICRGVNVIYAPRGNEMIKPRDKLIVLGNDEQLETFKHEAELTNKKYEPAHMLEKFMLKGILLDHASPFVGKSIHESGIRELIGGIVVGIERHNQRILNPDAQSILNVNDVIFIVGERDKINKLEFKYDLL
ncbi:MAG: hypothetical protein A3F14_02370 [Gammaproteobacteria bacterium RIFCSPHIGHO2_12_FULL_43_28]|nr:MAG: hypothetical protein A3F14_02370 [Gammaproteobacteria bacterium RIFCSPHIGHO2_12_FULL_43_28]